MGTPPVGTPLMNGGSVDNAREIVTPLTARGLVVLGLPSGGPVVLCAVDWTGIANESHDRFRAALAAGAGTDTARVALHTLHQHVVKLLGPTPFAVGAQEVSNVPV